MQEALDSIVVMMSPIVPHVAHAMWQALGHDGAVVDEQWPQVDPAALVKSQIQMAVQVNGKVRAQISVPAEAGRSDIEKAALADENVRRFTEGSQIRKVIVVPGKLINIVAG